MLNQNICNLVQNPTSIIKHYICLYLSWSISGFLSKMYIVVSFFILMWFQFHGLPFIDAISNLSLINIFIIIQFKKRKKNNTYEFSFICIIIFFFFFKYCFWKQSYTNFHNDFKRREINKFEIEQIMNLNFTAYQSYNA